MNPDNASHKQIVALLVAAAPSFAVEVSAAPATRPVGALGAEHEAAVTAVARCPLLRRYRANNGHPAGASAMSKWTGRVLQAECERWRGTSTRLDAHATEAAAGQPQPATPLPGTFGSVWIRSLVGRKHWLPALFALRAATAEGGPTASISLNCSDRRRSGPGR